MGCGCNHRYLTRLEQIRELAKIAAQMESEVFIIYRKPDRTYYFCKESEEFTGELIEYIYH